MKPRSKSTFVNHSIYRRYGLALVCTAVALGIRVGLTPVLGAKFPFATLYVAVLISAWLGGYGPAMATVLAGAVSVWGLFMQPEQGWLVSGDDQIGMMLFLITGATIGLFGARIRETEGRSRQTASALKEHNARNTAVLESALDGVIIMDHEGKIVEFNPAAERTFGYNRASAIGKYVGELIVPPSLRESHYRGLTRYLETGEGPVLDKRIEIEAMCADGSEFPVELAIARIVKDGPPLFTAYLRDISQQKAIERRRNARVNISQILAQTVAISDCVPAVLEVICKSLGWEMGALWTIDASANLIYCVEVWHESKHPLSQFEGVTREARFAPGIGLPGRIWTSRASAWILDVAQDANFPRAAAAIAAGLHSAFGCPLVSEGRVVGVIEFFSREIREPDADLLEMMGSVGSQIGQVIDRGRAVEALQKSEERIASVVDHVVDGIITIDERGIVETINPAAQRLFGYETAEVVGQNVKLLMPEPYRSGHDEYIVSYLQTGIARIIGIGREVEGRRKDGSTFPLELAISEFHLDRRRCFTGIVRDISERKKAESALRFLAEASITLASVTDPKSTLQRLSRLAVPFLADWCVVYLTRDNGAIEQPALAHAAPDKEAVLMELQEKFPLTLESPAPSARIMRSGKSGILSVVTAEHLTTLAAGNEEHLAILRKLNPRSYMFVSLVVRNQPIGALGFGISESERRFTEAELSVAEEFARRAAVAIENARLYHDLREADRRKDEFLAMLAHELRNPLAPIRNALELLCAGVDADTAQWATSLMQRQVQHIVRLVDDLLDVSRIMRGKIQLKTEPVELSSVIHHALEETKSAIDMQEHELQLSLPQGPVWIQADPVRMSQIVSNLLNNAAKYTDKGGRIALGVEPCDGKVTIAVSDSGIGIAPDMLDQIFTPFTQVSDSLDRSRGGLGIGLSLVRSLVQMHGGTVRARSEGIGKGSEFVVELPTLGRPTESTDVDGKPTFVAPRRVLVVDDSVAAAETLAVLLRNLWAHEVETAHDGAAALKKVAEFQPDVVLLDIGLPGLNGYEVAMQVRQMRGGSEIVLVAVTGYGQEEDRRRSLQAGFDEHLVKPAAVVALQKVFLHAKLSPQRVG